MIITIPKFDDGGKKKNIGDRSGNMKAHILLVWMMFWEPTLKKWVSDLGQVKLGVTAETTAHKKE